MFDFETLIQLEAYHRDMANYYNNAWLDVGDENYILCIQHLSCLKTVRKMIKDRI